jgi:hypothetical protein
MDGLLDEWINGVELKEKTRMALIHNLLKKAFRFFLQDCFIFMYLIRNHPAIHSSNHPWDGSYGLQ